MLTKHGLPVALSTFLLISANVHADYIIALVERDHGMLLGDYAGPPALLEWNGGMYTVQYNPWAHLHEGTYTIDVFLYAEGAPFIGAGLTITTSPGVTASGLSLNTTDFDRDLTSSNTTDPNQNFQLATTDKGPYTTPMRMATFQVVVSDWLFSPSAVTATDMWMGDPEFNTHEARLLPEPATALLLLGTLMLFRRGHD